MTIANSQGSSALFLQDGVHVIELSNVEEHPMYSDRILSSSDGHEYRNIISRHLS